MRKIFLITLPIFFVLAIACSLHQYLIDFNETLSTWGMLFSVCFVLLALGRMFFTGSFVYTLWARIGYSGFAAIIIGLFLGVERGSKGQAFVLIGWSIIGGSYLVHFIQKQMKTFLDWEKALFIIIFSITIIIKTLYYRYNEELSLLSLITTIILISTFYLQELKDIRKKENELDNEGENVFKYED
ncbi:MAG: hypothetical protein WC756_13400 [Taibaiella sp.]|jgi:hypothetical protein